MKPEIKERILRVLRHDLGNAEDNMLRARTAFSGCTPDEMRQEYGYSGETRQKILDDYTRWVNETREAIAVMQEVG